MAASKQPPAVRITRPMSLFLDAVRFGAACAVLLHHAAFTKFGTYLPWTLTRTGIEPVIAFFVLSGFVIAYTAEVNDRSAYEYGLSRATRLLSVTIPAVALTVLLDGIGSSIAPKLYADHWSNSATLANLQMPPGVQVGLTVTFLNELWMLNVWPGTNSPFWSLGYEAAYYVLFGIAFYEGRKWPRIAGLILFSLLIGPKDSIATTALAPWCCSVAPLQESDARPARRRGIIRHSDAHLCRVCRKRRTKCARPRDGAPTLVPSSQRLWHVHSLPISYRKRSAFCRYNSWI